jgi:hydrophobe/amphiphile efflux-1 (HAE1) family protein
MAAEPGMSITERCIRRPIATLLLSFGLLLCGIIAYIQMPIAPLPRIDFPTISISARLPGAAPETMAAIVASPLERRLGAIPGVVELTSTSSHGSTNITALFDINRDIDGAARDVQVAINASASDLPVDLPRPPTYRKINPGDAPILILAVTSKTLSTMALYDAVDSILSQRISQIDGVGQVTVSGAAKPAVRVQINPIALAASGLSLDEVRSRISAANRNLPKGILDGETQAMAIDSNSELWVADAYKPLILTTSKAATLRLSDIATVTDSVENDQQAGWYNLEKAIIVIISKQTDANVIETTDTIKSLLPKLQSWMPAGTTIDVLVDRTQTIRASVLDVEITLLISIVLVVIVVWFSLGRTIPTIAASITVPLVLAITFAIIALLGFSLNNISLMALTVCVCFIIDDAIVMIENIAHHVEQGDTPIEAAIKGANEITFTVISISISLIAVFIPILFMGGIVGRMFQEFAITLTVAVAASILICLTVTPTIYALLMNWHQRNGNRTLHRTHPGERIFLTLQTAYERLLSRVLRYQGAMLLVMLATIAGTIALYVYIPKGFFPQQDTGMLRGTTEARSDISFAAMAEKQQLANTIVLADPAVQGMGTSIGSSGGPNSSNNQGRMFIALKPLSERDVSAEEVIARLRPQLAKIQGISVFLQSVQELNVGGRATKTQFQFQLASESLSDLREWTPKLINALKNESDITDVTSDQDAAGQQLTITVDRDRAAQLGIAMDAISQTLQNAFAQRQISTMYQSRNQYHVVMELLPHYQQNQAALDHIFIKSTTGKQVRLSSIASYQDSFAPLSVQHQGQFPAATLSFNLPKGTALGDAAKRIETVVTAIQMPPTIRSGFAGNAAAFASSLKDEPMLILTAFLAIYFVLGILYENTLHPITIISTLPSAGLGALLALLITGYDLSLISFIGVILLMGIVKKNGIMLVDFAIHAERHGMQPIDAIREACRRRFRPILMTTIAAIMGALPLIFNGGNGAELRQPLGIAIVGGLIVSQILTLYTTPVMYLALGRIGQRFKKLKKASYGES